MKKTIVFTVCILFCFLAYSQGADNPGRTAGLTLIPRLELNPHFSPGKKGEDLYFWKDKAETYLGNTSFYSLFEGNLSENLSFSVCNHWLSSAPADLYKNSLRSDNTNWLDWFNLTYSFGRFSITLGKDMVATGGLEYDDYDFDVHYDLSSSFWHNFSCYQWGGKAGFTTENESTSFYLQMTTSPFGERPFASGLYNYSGQWKGEYGPVRTIWSATAIQTAPKEYIYLFSLGQKVEIGNFSLGLDYMNKVGDKENILVDGTTLLGTAGFTNCKENLEFGLKGGFEKIKDGTAGFFCGASAHWFPLKGSKDLRLHSVISYNKNLDSIGASIGAIYYFNFKVF